MLGIRGVMEISSQLLLRRVINVKSSRFKNFSHFLWIHCLKSAEAGTVLGDKDDAYINYLLGLVHSIGYVVVLSSYVDAVGNSSDESINDLKVIRHICFEQGHWLSTRVAQEWELPDLILNTLDEYDHLCGALILNSEFEAKLSTTNTLFLSSAFAQIHSLLTKGKLDRERGNAFLESIGLDMEAKRMAALFERLRLLEVEDS
jgi:HD-like signal output (HDOD) protein